MTTSADDLKMVAQAYLRGVQQDLESYGGVDVSRIEPIRKSKDFAIAAFDAVAVILARSYQSGALDYETADWIANVVDGEMLELMMQLQTNETNIDTPQDWSEVYEAFDGGEFDHFGRSQDPIREFTDPGIQAFLARIETRG